MLIQMLRSLFGRSLWFFAYGLQVYGGEPMMFDSVQWWLVGFNRWERMWCRDVVVVLVVLKW
ncbi:hypothetical protein Hanom_Chr15g01347871 [Helianthus anomalus]